ncbi:hybrid sensor histidine kinase/response regulator [Oscillatoria sp. FACHB-1406]|uniref:hybrid sensor histidine kinase/response regulator n=1 Tax=Oscillatoria sp. FACHB-1406 TaxID=2692846 RepID=UPI001681D67B|nr:hybrid sensor histidine kinase/response regulator [Oscillatoria sp. FACHB-1406]MBD2579531.1 response regulator [Oscillatoria sp. FACHB-1406]
MSEYSKLELFRQEIEARVVILKKSLPVLKTQPLAMTELEQAARAAHSAWGTARIVKMEVASNLAQLMKECLIAARDKAVTLQEEQIDVLLHASDLLLSISQVANGEFERWMSERSWDLATTQKAISLVLNSGSAVASVSLQEQETGDRVTLVEEQAIPETHQPLSEETLAQQQESAELSEELPRVISASSHAAIAPSTDTANRAITPTPPATLSIDDASMMDLFRLEAEAQVTLLNDGLLDLENNPQSAQALETLMRAAHSIKGAARIVGLDAIVNLAHGMEDCFVAAQNQTIALDPDNVDVLLQGVDLLQAIGQTSDAKLPGWLAQQSANFEALRVAIAAILNPGAKPVLDRETEKPAPPSSLSVVPVPSRSQPTEIPSEANIEPIPTVTVAIKPQSAPSIASVAIQERPKEAASSSALSEQTATQNRVVRISAENLNRIMGLAGESLIEANWLQPHADSMMSLKWRLAELARTLEQLEDSLERGTYRQEGKEYLAQARNQEQECLDLLSDRLGELELYAQRTANLSDRLYREVITSHMRPFADGVQGFPRMIRDLARQLNKQVKLDIVGKATPVDRDILKKLEAPLTHILRNATDHGIELPEERMAVGKPAEGTIRLEAFHRGAMLAITVTDDGKGISPEQLRSKAIDKNLVTSEMAARMSDTELLEFLFLPGFSTAQQITEISGRGVGLDIAKSMAQEVGGTVRATSQPGKGTSFHFQLPLTLSVVRTLLVEISGKPYAVPLARIDQIVTVERSEISEVENRQYFTMNQQNIGLIAARQVLELPEPPPHSGALSVAIISDGSNPYGLVVDRFLGERDLVVRPLDPRLGKVPDISATSLMGDGSPILIIDVSDIVRSMDALLHAGGLTKVEVEAQEVIRDKRKRVLVVDDSITVREMERKLLENRGYKVDIAVNGMEGWNAVRTNAYDLVISDIDMPRMNGIEFVKQMRSHPRLHSMPVIIVSYRDREEDRIAGLEAGADYYLTKSSFHDETLINAVMDLVGR